MTAWGLHCAHELHAPSALLDDAVAAQAAGFVTVSCSDPHGAANPGAGLHGFPWDWLGAVMARTHLPVGTIVTPGAPESPTVSAQAAASLAQAHPGRLWLALTSADGCVGGLEGDERAARLEECAELVRRVLAGQSVARESAAGWPQGGRHATLTEAPVPLLAAATDPESAARCAPWADGLVTTWRPPEEMQRIVHAYRRRGGRGPLILQAPHGWGPTESEAREMVRRQWPRLVRAAGASGCREAGEATDDEVAACVPVSSRLDDHRSWMEQYEEIGFDAVCVLPLGAPAQALIDAYGREVLPRLR